MYDTTLKALTVREFCRRYGIGRSQTYVEIAAGRLPIKKAGRRTLILTSDAEKWLQALPSSSSGLGRARG